MTTGEDPPAVTIKVRRDGPLKVTGPVRLVDHEGQAIEVDDDDVVLCRCGRSGDKPFCDGSHRHGFDGGSVGPGHGQRCTGPAQPAPPTW